MEMRKLKAYSSRNRVSTLGIHNSELKVCPTLHIYGARTLNKLCVVIHQVGLMAVGCPSK